MAERTWQAVAALVDPVRRSLYEYIRRQRRPVTREQAAQAIAISRGLAAFHLDKLVEAGMLRTRYEAPAGPPRGRGRTPKVYEAFDVGLTLSVPQRNYELVGRILAEAVAGDPADAWAAALRHATSLGRYLGRRTAAASGSRHADAGRAILALADLGYEPHQQPDGVVLDNCPFSALATEHTALICGINARFINGLLDGLGCDTVRAQQQPRPDGCCVRLHHRG